MAITKDKSLKTSFQIFPSATLFYAQIIMDRAKKAKGSNALQTSFTLNTWTALRCYLYLLGSILSVYTQTATYCFIMKHCTWLVGGTVVPSRAVCEKMGGQKLQYLHTNICSTLLDVSANYWTDTLHRHKKLWRRNR